jgi:putative DNA primase/helicase
MADAPTDQPFTALGFLEGRYHYYSFLLQKVISLTPVEHRKENLFNLAPLSYWEKHYKATKGIEWEKAVDSLIQTCANKGLFDPGDVIGRGIWLIDGKGVTHYGDKVLIDGKIYDEPKTIPESIAGKKVFEKSKSLQLGEPDKNADFSQIQTILSQLSFQDVDSPLFISGWVVCGMAAGALHWRPHGWITGKSGYGKSAVINAVKRLLGNCGEHYTGETTEAGIRQDLKNDCRAVTYDEAEPKTHQAQQSIQKVLNLFRQASSDETAKIAKGTVTGKGINFRIRSCALFGSCNAYLTEEPDKNRFFLVEMAKPMEKGEYVKWEFKMQNTFTAGFQSALHSRISQNIVTLAANAKTFTSVLAERFSNNRAGDQYGTLMAGAFLLTSTDLISKENAADWVKDVKFPPDEVIEEDKSDEMELLNYMLDRMIPFKKQYGDKVINMDRPLAELIESSFGESKPEGYTYTDAEIALSYKGIKTTVENGKKYVAISTNNTAIADLISRSRFAGLDWSPILRRIKGSIVPKKVYRIGQGKKPCSVTLVPWDIEEKESETLFKRSASNDD